MELTGAQQKKRREVEKWFPTHGRSTPVGGGRAVKLYTPQIISIYLGFGALLPEHPHLHAVVHHILHSLVGRNLAPSSFVYVLQCSAMWTLLLLFHHSSPTISIAETVYEMYIHL
jgi:hypothetical protein